MTILPSRARVLAILSGVMALMAGGNAAAQAAPDMPAPITTASGVVYQSLREGQGTSPTATDVVRVNYKGTLADGTVFDSSYDRHEPAQFPLYGVIPCWTEGVQLMKPGGKARLTCPPQTAYGESGAGGSIPPNATLTFEIELLAVVGGETAPEH